MLADKNGPRRDQYGEPWLTDSRRAVIQKVYEESYGIDSRTVHQKDTAIYLSVLQSKPMTEDELAIHRLTPVLQALTLHAALLAEVGRETRWPQRTLSLLRSAWARLVQDFDPALELHRMRYRGLLARR
jgi:hypothetical protein